MQLLSLAGRTEAFPCSQPVSTGDTPVAGDCLFILRAALGSRTCSRPCACDLDGDARISASDALGCLQHSVGRPAALDCGLCRHPLEEALAHFEIDSTLPWTFGPCAYCPDRLRFHVFLDGYGTGSLGIARDDLIIMPVASLSAISWERSGDEFIIVPGSAEVFPDGKLMWESWTVRLSDVDGDGVLEHGRGTIRADFEQQLSNDLYDAGTIEGGFVTKPDRDEPILSLHRVPLRVEREVFPSDAFSIRTSEPVLASELVERVRVLVDGTSLPALVTVEDGVGPFTTSAHVRLDEFPPFQSEIVLDPSEGITDGWRNRAQWSGDPLYTTSDPGAALLNPGFEGTGGWAELETCNGLDVVVPTEGFQHACILDFGELNGYIDLEPSARELRLSVATLAYYPFEHDVGFVTLSVVHPSRSILAYDAALLHDEYEPYPCGGTLPDGCAVLQPRDIVVDVSEFAGERVFVHARVRSFPPFTYYAMLLDDLRIQ